MAEIIFTAGTCACIELTNDSPYFAPESYTVTIDGQVKAQGNTNVFTIFDLNPNTEYKAVIHYPGGEETIAFKTAEETCCVSVRDFGAYGDGIHEDTGAIQAAINFIPEGGRIYFPEGTYLTLPLALKSHVTLEIAKGATILASTQRERYPIIKARAASLTGGEDLPLASFEGNEVDAYESIIHAAYAEDITLIGQGTIDGNGQNGDWWKGFHEFPAARPRVIFLNRCKKVALCGLTVQNGPTWHIHPFFSKDVSLLDLFIKAPKVSPNTDAIDPESCDGVRIIGCRFSVGDDCIAVKSGKIEMARRYKVSADHHTIRNCLMDDGHGAVTLGSELSAGIKNLTVSHCYFKGTDRGLRIKSRRGRGKESLITNVSFDNIRMENVLTPIVINLWYNCCDPDRESEYVWSREKLPVDDRTPHLGEFAFRNMVCTGTEVAACYIDGLPESPIKRVVMEDISITFADECREGVPAMQNFAKKRSRLGLYLDNVEEIELNRVTLKGQEGSEVVADHYRTLLRDGKALG